MVSWLLKAIKVAVFVGGADLEPGMRWRRSRGLGILGVAVALGAQDLFKTTQGS